MYTLIVSLIILVAVLLILVILAQNSKGGGLSSQFGGSGASNMIGVKKTSDLLEKITWGLAIAMLLLALASNINFGNGDIENFADRVEDRGPALDLNSLPQIEDAEPGTGGVDSIQ